MIFFFTVKDLIVECVVVSGIFEDFLFVLREKIIKKTALTQVILCLRVFRYLIQFEKALNLLYVIQ